MRSGQWRGVTLALGLACALALAAVGTNPARAGDFHTIPRLVPAVDVNTGGPYYAPPIPYGHYAGKNLLGRCSAKVGGLLHGGLGGLAGLGHGLGKGCGPCGACGGKGLGCGACGGTGDACGGTRCGLLGGLGHGSGDPGCGLLHKGGRHGGDCGHATTTVCATSQAVPTAQAPCPAPSAQCGDPGCPLPGRHKHRGCGLCFGRGCGKCADPADPCKACGGKGCGLCGLGGLGGHGLGALAACKGAVHHLLGHDKIDWFVGPGGPVPLTPGYTPYVVTTRSPRDFLAFPPFVP